MLDLISFFAANEIYPDPKEHNFFKYSGELMYFIALGEEISVFSGNFDLNCDENDEVLVNFAQSSVNPCTKHKGCLENPGLRRVLFGKVYDNCCRSTLCFNNISAADLPHIKNITYTRKNDINNMHEIKRELRKDINETLEYKYKANALDFANYLYEKYELRRVSPKIWEIFHGEQILCTIRLELSKLNLTLVDGEYDGEYNVEGYKHIKEEIEGSIAENK